VVDVRQELERRVGHALAGNLSVSSDRKEGIFLRPGEGDRAWHGVQRGDLLFVGGKNLVGDGARDDVLDKLDGLGRG
jgi:hypothetical protein